MPMSQGRDLLQYLSTQRLVEARRHAHIREQNSFDDHIDVGGHRCEQLLLCHLRHLGHEEHEKKPTSRIARWYVSLQHQECAISHICQCWQQGVCVCVCVPYALIKAFKPQAIVVGHRSKSWSALDISAPIWMCAWYILQSRQARRQTSSSCEFAWILVAYLSPLF